MATLVSLRNYCFAVAVCLAAILWRLINMPAIVMVLVVSVLVGCGTYKSNEIWRRSTCNQIIDVDEKARCLEEATLPENEYKRDVEAAKE